MKKTLLLFLLLAFGLVAAAQTYVGTMNVDGYKREEVKVTLRKTDSGDYTLTMYRVKFARRKRPPHGRRRGACLQRQALREIHHPQPHRRRLQQGPHLHLQDGRQTLLLQRQTPRRQVTPPSSHLVACEHDLLIDVKRHCKRKPLRFTPFSHFSKVWFYKILITSILCTR